MLCFIMLYYIILCYQGLRGGRRGAERQLAALCAAGEAPRQYRNMKSTHIMNIPSSN